MTPPEPLPNVVAPPREMATAIQGLDPHSFQVGPDPAIPRNAPDLTGFLPNDHGNACRLIALYGRDLRFCHLFRKWLVWDGRRWAVDRTDRAKSLAKHAMIEALRQAIEKRLGREAENFARSSLDARRITSLLAMAESEIYVTPDELDANPHLLNFRNGTIDLRTGALGPHRREHFLTKRIDHNYRPGAECPRFARFLNRVLGAEPAAAGTGSARAQRLVRYLQTAFGYSLTGLTTEKAVFIAHGTGNNGKTTLLATFLRLLGEYGAMLQIETLMARQETSNTQADLADLKGARFVLTSETEEGQRLAEGKLKRITQGTGRIKAVRKYENPVEFEETHKLWMDANHKPVVRGTDDAIWNRLRLIPFEVTIAPHEMDRELPSKLLAEAEGILAWAVAGAECWYREGLGAATELDGARYAWRMESDPVGRFVAEGCTTGAGRAIAARELYLAYGAWAEAAGEPVITGSAFGRRLTSLGFGRRHRETGCIYEGISLLEPAASDAF